MLSTEDSKCFVTLFPQINQQPYSMLLPFFFFQFLISWSYHSFTINVRANPWLTYGHYFFKISLVLKNIAPSNDCIFSDSPSRIYMMISSNIYWHQFYILPSHSRLGLGVLRTKVYPGLHILLKLHNQPPDKYGSYFQNFSKFDMKIGVTDTKISKICLKA